MRPSRARFSSGPSGHSAGSCRGSPRRRARPCGGASPPSSSSRSSGPRPLTSRFCRRRPHRLRRRGRPAPGNSASWKKPLLLRTPAARAKRPVPRALRAERSAARMDRRAGRRVDVGGCRHRDRRRTSMEADGRAHRTVGAIAGRDRSHGGRPRVPSRAPARAARAHLGRRRHTARHRHFPAVRSCCPPARSTR